MPDTLFDRAAVPGFMLEEGGLRVDGSDFMRRVEQAAGAWRAQGIGAGQVLAWLGHNRIEALVQCLACQRLGAVWLPLNWRVALPEWTRQIEHAGAAALAHDAVMADAATALAAQARWTRGPAPGVAAGDALLLYTSGTTAAPKAALHTLAGLQANARAAIDAQGLDAQTRTLAVLPLFHAGGLCIQTLPTLVAGGAVRLHPRFDADAWFDDVASWRPTTCLVVPALMHALIEHARWLTADLSSLRFVTAGSQIVPPALIAAFHARDVAVAQVYGATETGPVSLVVRPHEAHAHAAHSGCAALGVEARLAADGELLLRAPQLMRGYLHEGASPFDGDGFFASGDLAVEHPGGWFQVVGRKKELIISGGENIHPAEIEHLAAERPEVAEAAVVGLADARWGEVPVLALVLRPGTVLDAAALQALFDARLARFKHPRRVVVVDALPRTALGKVQRLDLAQQLAARSA